MKTSGFWQIKIFLVDDDSDDRELFNQSLIESGLGFELTTFEDGGKFVPYLSEVDIYPDIIFLDINMPKVDGVECLKKIRSNDNFKNIIIIMFSTSANNSHVENTYKLGANLYVIKPLYFQDEVAILMKIANMLEENKFSQINKDNYVLKSRTKVL